MWLKKQVSHVYLWIDSELNLLTADPAGGRLERTFRSGHRAVGHSRGLHHSPCCLGCVCSSIFFWLCTCAPLILVYILSLTKKKKGWTVKTRSLSGWTRSCPRSKRCRRWSPGSGRCVSTRRSSPVWNASWHSKQVRALMQSHSYCVHARRANQLSELCVAVPTQGSAELRSFRNASAIAALQDEAQLTLNSYIHTRWALRAFAHAQKTVQFGIGVTAGPQCLFVCWLWVSLFPGTRLSPAASGSCCCSSRRSAPSARPP